MNTNGRGGTLKKVRERERDKYRERESERESERERTRERERLVSLTHLLHPVALSLFLSFF